MVGGRIDTHQHIVPPAYAEWLVSKGMAAGGMPIPKWSPEQALEIMADNNVDAAILSISPHPASISAMTQKLGARRGT